MTTSPREFLLSIDGPTVREPIDALRLLIECDREGTEILTALYFDRRRPTADSLAGYARRRAYVLVRAAALWPEFEPAADAAVTWQRAESAAAQEAVELARGVSEFVICTWCGKKPGQGVTIVTGPGVNICGDCIKLVSIVHDEAEKESAGKARESGGATSETTPGADRPEADHL